MIVRLGHLLLGAIIGCALVGVDALMRQILVGNRRSNDPGVIQDGQRAWAVGSGEELGHDPSCLGDDLIVRELISKGLGRGVLVLAHHGDDAVEIESMVGAQLLRGIPPPVAVCVDAGDRRYSPWPEGLSREEVAPGGRP